MKEFFKAMLSSDENVSSKRIISLISLLLYIIAFVSSLSGIQVAEEIWYTLISLILGSSALTLTSSKSKNI